MSIQREKQQPARRQRRRSIDPKVLAKIQVLAAVGDVTATAIHEAISNDPDLASLFTPSLRTVQEIVRGLGVPEHDSDEERVTWSPMDEVDAPLPVLEVLAEVIVRTRGARNTLSHSEVEWIKKVHRAVPDLPPWSTWALAISYRTQVTHGRSVDELDWFVAFAPWRSESRWKRYLKACASGWIKISTPFFILERQEWQARATATALRDPETRDSMSEMLGFHAAALEAVRPAIEKQLLQLGDE